MSRIVTSQKDYTRKESDLALAFARRRASRPKVRECQITGDSAITTFPLHEIAGT